MNSMPPDRSQAHQAWLEEIYARYERPLAAYARSQLRGDAELARDVVQDTFVRLCQEAWPEIADRVEGWVFVVCRNRCIDIRKRWENRMVTTLPQEHWPHAIARQSGPPDQAESREDQARLRKFIDELSERQRQVILMRLQQGFSYQQIAEATGTSVSSVGFHLHEALCLLRQKMNTRLA